MATQVPQRVSRAEAQRRAATVAEARHSTELEGRQSPPAARQLQDEYAAGRMSADELVEKTKALYGIA